MDPRFIAPSMHLSLPLRCIFREERSCSSVFVTGSSVRRKALDFHENTVGYLANSKL